MAKELRWDTVSPILQRALTTLMQCDLLANFRLVGGTSLSLQMGHRISTDIDLFTDSPYGSIDFIAIQDSLRNTFSYTSTLNEGLIGMGMSCFIGTDENNMVKLDLYHTDEFIQPVLKSGVYRLATTEEIIALKIDIVQREARKKDFWDLHELMEGFTLKQMIALHKQRYPYNHEPELIKMNLANFIRADDDFDPICLLGKHWELIKLDLSRAAEAL